MEGTHSILFDAIIVLGSATFVAVVFHALKIPTIVGFLSAGILIGPHGLGLISSAPQAEFLTEIAAIFLMFTLGLEFSLRRLKELRKAFLNWGGTQVFLTFLSVFLLSHWVLDFSFRQSLLFGFLVTLSSTATVLKLLYESREILTPYGQSSVGILLAQDVAVIPMILWLAFLSTGTGGIEIGEGELLIWVLKAGGIFLGSWLGSKYVIPFVLERTVHTRSRELFFFCLLFFCFGASYLFEVLGLTLSLGALLAGVMISESPFGKQAMSDFTPLRDNFLSFFFVSIGMLLDLRFVGANLGTILLIFAGVVLLKIGIIYSLGIANGYSPYISIVTGIMLFQIGEFSFILAERGRAIGLLGDAELQYFLSVSILSLAITPFAFRAAPKLGFQRFLTEWLPEQLRPVKAEIKLDKTQSGEENHAIIVGFGIGGQNVATALRGLEIPYRIIDINPSAVKEHAKKGEPILYGDATDPRILEKVGIEKAGLAVVTVAGSAATDRVVGAIHRARADLHIMVRVHYLREASELHDFENVDIVVGEFETSIEILARTLVHYGVAPDQISKFILDTKKNFTKSHDFIVNSLRRNIELPTWEALSSLKPVKVGESDFAVGKGMLDLNMRKSTGATVVMVFREGVGSTIPHGDFVFSSGDIAYLIGSSDAIESARNLLTKGA